MLNNVEKDREEIAKAVSLTLERALKGLEENAEIIIRDIEKKLEEDSKELEKYREREVARILAEIDRTAEANYSRAVEEGLKVLSAIVFRKTLDKSTST